MTTEFDQLNLHPQLVQTVTGLGYITPMPIQSEVIPLMIAGHDVIGQAQTGTGKTAAFALPILHNLEPGQRNVQALVLTPTRELALQVATAFTDYAQGTKARVLAVYGGASYNLQINQLKRGVEIVVGTPGRLLDLIRKHILDITHLHTLILDEADEMLSMGFIDDIETILAETPSTRQTALFSATMPKEIRRLADRYMHDPLPVTIQPELVTVEATEQRHYLVNSGDRQNALIRLLEMEDVTSALIFVRTRGDSGNLANSLTTRGFPAEALNGDLSQEARERTMKRFRLGQIKVLVATDVAARGLDVDDISHVFNYDLPDDPEIYVHRIGRTGRAGKSGVAISFLIPSMKRQLSQIEAFTHKRVPRATLPSEEDIRTSRETKLMKQVSTWLARGRCRRERELVEKLVADGVDPIEIAAVALKMARGEDKQRPIDTLSTVVETHSDRPERGKRPASGRSYGRQQGNRSDEPGMVRLSLNMGKMHGIRPNDIVGSIARHASIPGNVIGKILIQDRQTLVDVPEDLVKQVLSNTRQVTIHRQAVTLQRA
jgi:ATP-dependent RNA helicase DeaD